MATAVFTVYEGNYHLGVGALINSLVKSGFYGCVFVGYRDRKPPWLAGLTRLSEDEYFVDPVRLVFFQVTTRMHLGYYKPFAATQIFEDNSEIDSLIYSDPDIIFLAKWNFFESWLRHGLAVVSDSNFGQIPPGHPWREEWTRLLAESSTEILNSNRSHFYVNGGFFGISRDSIDFLTLWCKLTNYADKRFCDITRYEMSERTRAVVSDQDLINASLLASDVQCVTLGPEAMGFTGYHFIMSHAIGSPKPWSQAFVLESLKGNPPSQASKLWLNHTVEPIASLAPSDRFVKRLDMQFAMLISRVWKR